MATVVVVAGSVVVVDAGTVELVVELTAVAAEAGAEIARFGPACDKERSGQPAPKTGQAQRGAVVVVPRPSVVLGATVVVAPARSPVVVVR